MKKLLFLVMTALLVSISAEAQYYPYGRTHHARKSHSSYRHHYRAGDTYGGVRFGLGLSTVNSDSPYLDGKKTRTGFVGGVVLGTRLSDMTPLYLETGGYFTQKGGKSETGGEKFTYALDYVEIPLTFKYKVDLGDDVALEPFAGGFFACGVNGKIKDYQNRAAYSSFSDDYRDNFNRLDGGIRVGCGLSIDQMYVEAAYDFGLANVGKDSFDDTHTGAFNLTLGLNF